MNHLRLFYLHGIKPYYNNKLTYFLIIMNEITDILKFHMNKKQFFYLFYLIEMRI